MNSLPDLLIIHEILDRLMPVEASPWSVSKNWHRLVNATPTIRGIKLLDERLQMILQDSPAMRERSYDALAYEWEHRHRWAWPDPWEDRPTDRTPLWRPGQYVDALDRIGVWGPALIVGEDLRPTPVFNSSFSRYRRQYKVRFLGWSKVYDEWVPPRKIERLAARTLNPRGKFGSLARGHKSWALYLDKMRGWRVDSIEVTDVSGNKKTINHGAGSVTLTAGQVDDCMRATSDACTFLTLTHRNVAPRAGDLRLRIQK
jgi:hypothetical protein